jgi:hypothetical protein
MFKKDIEAQKNELDDQYNLCGKPYIDRITKELNKYALSGKKLKP